MTARQDPSNVSLRLRVDPGVEVSALLSRPPNARCLLVLGHGAGAGMRHPTMEALNGHLNQAGIGTFRYQFPYMERGGGPPDQTSVLIATVRAAVLAAAAEAPDLSLFAGGKSMGGRMTSLAAAEEPLPHVRGIVFFGFPLHPAGRPGTGRANHLAKVTIPLLFLQGTRDRLAELDLIQAVCSGLGSSARLYVIEGADHSFHVLKRSGRTDVQVLIELAGVVQDWTLSFTRGQ